MFGKYLVERGLINEQQLLEALEAQRSMRPSIGRIAFERGVLDLDQVVAVMEAQAQSPLRFCALAVELGYMTTAQRDELLAEQEQGRVPLGQVLASLGTVPADELEAALDAYHAERESGDAR
jgi:hypothetical protein